MPMPLLLAAALATAGSGGFGPALADAELAACAALAVHPAAPPFAPLALRSAAAPVQEQMDGWWAEDGASLLAAARPSPALPPGLDLAALASGRFALHLTLSVTVATR